VIEGQPWCWVRDGMASSEAMKTGVEQYVCPSLRVANHVNFFGSGRVLERRPLAVRATWDG
jgi:hypothetical protein